MAGQFQKTSMYIEHNPAIIENVDFRKNVDDDGRPKRTGTWMTASAHIITAVIGSGVLSLVWAIAQLGWVAGPAVLMAFSFITYFISSPALPAGLDQIHPSSSPRPPPPSSSIGQPCMVSTRSNSVA
ncbi:hypothetical protein FF1_012330 [Malus domestica]